MHRTFAALAVTALLVGGGAVTASAATPTQEVRPRVAAPTAADAVGHLDKRFPRSS